MSQDLPLISAKQIAKQILVVRNHKVILDTDLAALYGVTTKRLNEQVKRNQARFPADFMFQLTTAEKQEVVANCDHLSNLKYSRTNPYAFTEHGAIMAASVLNTTHAIEISVLVVRTFVQLRQLLESNQALKQKIEALEKKYDKQFRIVFEAIHQLMTPPEPKKHPMGFIHHSDNKKKS